MIKLGYYEKISYIEIQIMENVEKLNLKIRIQILDTNDQTLLQSTINQNDINDLKVYQNVSLVDETYLMLLDELEQKLNQN